MNKILYFLGGLVVGGAAGTGATYLVLKKREDKIINEELEKLSKEETTEYKHDVFSDEPAIVPQNEEKPIPELAEMAKKVKTEEGEKTDYTGFSKSQEEKKEEPKRPIEYVDEDKADEYETENNYEIIDMDYYQDGILLYDGPDGDYAKTTPEELGIDMSKAQNDELYAVDHTKQKIYLISISNQNYDDEEEENEYDGEQSES